MASLWHDPAADYSPPIDAITDEEELHNCLILGMTLYFFHVRDFRIVERMPTRVIRSRNGKKLLFNTGASTFIHDLGIKDPTFNPNIGTLEPIITFADPDAAYAHRKRLQG